MSEVTKPSVDRDTFSDQYRTALEEQSLHGMAELAMTAGHEANYWRGVTQEQAKTLAYMRERVRVLEEREAAAFAPSAPAEPSVITYVKQGDGKWTKDAS